MSVPSALLSSSTRTWLRARPKPPCWRTLAQPQFTATHQRWAHTVRIILKEDLPNGKAYKGEVLTVKAGYARNHLIPGKYALYATPENFVRLNMKDPDLETAEEKAARLARESMSEETAQELKAADILKHYLRNKVVKMHRRVDPESQKLSPGKVTAQMLRSKISKQLRIDLDDHETIHLLEDTVMFDDTTPAMLLAKVEALDVTEPCQREVRQVGDYVARVTLAGGYAVPLKWTVVPSN